MALRSTTPTCLIYVLLPMVCTPGRRDRRSCPPIRGGAMSSIIIAACPVHGHVTPLLTVARGFVERGDDVRFITGAAFADRVTATGAVHIALPPDADFNFD